MQLTQELGFGNSGFFLSYFYPPWTLPVFLPFGLISYQISRTLWFLVSVIIYTSCALWLWNMFQGSSSKRWIIILCIVLISPGVFALIEGQVTPLILMGIVGFVYFEKRRRWFFAGSFLALITFKIHILYLFWIALLFWIVYTKRWIILAGLITTLAISSLFISLIDPNIFLYYLRMSTNNLPSYCTNPTISSYLCLLNNNVLETWHLLIGPMFGLIWLIFYWLRKKDEWNWMDTIPLVIFVSLITAPYTWMHDGLLFIIAVIGVIILILNQGLTKIAYSIISLFVLANSIVYLLAGNFRNNQIIFDSARIFL